MLLTLNYLISLGNIFLGAAWIRTFKFLCLTRQVSIPWPCFTTPHVWLVQNTKSISCSTMVTAAMQISWSSSDGNSVLDRIWELSERCQCNLGCNPYPQQQARLCKLCCPQFEPSISRHSTVWGEVKFFLLLKLKLFLPQVTLYAHTAQGER